MFSLKQDQAKVYREWLLAMTNAKIITLSKEQISIEIDTFERMRQGMDIRVVLHNDEEETTFKNIMDNFFKSLKYKITEDNSTIYQPNSTNPQ